ncbi:unnamed protein product [Rhodiola kirilowii]
MGKEGEEDEHIMHTAPSSPEWYMLGDTTVNPAYHFNEWLELLRKRNGKIRSSGSVNSFKCSQSLLPRAQTSNPDTKGFQFAEQVSETLWERLSKAAMLDIESSSLPWDMLSSIHHAEHNTSAEHSEDEMNKALEVTVNSGGVIFFALFKQHEEDGSSAKEAAAVIKISSSRMTTQSERLGYEFAKLIGVRTPQARVVHSFSSEWLQIKEAAERARDLANSDGDEVGELTCSELLEALELSRCIFLMNYVHGCPLLESSNAFEPPEVAEKTAASLGRILMLDLVIRNEDRLPCRELRWRGNPSNLLLAHKLASVNMYALEEISNVESKEYKARANKALQKERRAVSVDSKLSRNSVLETQASNLYDVMESPKFGDMSLQSDSSYESTSDIHIVAIDSGVPRCPPAGKRADDQAIYPKLVELLLNSSDFSSNFLHDITCGKLGTSYEEMNQIVAHMSRERNHIVQEFRGGFRGALRDLQGFHIFLLTLHQKLENLLRLFMNIINRGTPGDYDKEELAAPDSPTTAAGVSAPSLYSPNKERVNNETAIDIADPESQKVRATRSSIIGHREHSDFSSPISREGWHGKFYRGSGEPLRCLRLTSKLRDFQRFAKDDVELSKELEQWNEMLKSEAVGLCQEGNFNSGFFEGSDSNNVIDAYELKVRLEHILERISFISDAANTERPSLITGSLFIGGALAARSIYTLQHLGITNILCLCSNEIGQSDSQFYELFEYKNFSIFDEEDSDIGNIFDEACDYIDYVEQSGGKVLVHCFEGRSRSATVVLAYLMLRKKLTLLHAWNTLKRVHRRAQPNDGFAKILLELDSKLHGKVSMEWQQRKPTMKVCPICGKNAGLSSSSLKLHLQKSHKKLSSGSVDSAMNMEIQKALAALKMSRGGSVSPKQRQPPSTMDE